ncbi:HEAT repeat domain-containing protein [Nostoc sp. CHAB 5844]|nr:HEAT repeat domain-containing protein [Nostoc sp. CHAB 5844]
MSPAWASVDKIGVEKLLEELQSKREPQHKQQFQIAVIGRTGTGKSSLINSLGGRKIAPVGNYEPVTAKVEKYSFTVGKAQLSIVDTPGIGDDEQEERYLDAIRQIVEQSDSFLFVSILPESRVSGDEKRAIKIISEKLGSKVWERSTIVFTFSDYVEPSQYAIALQKRTELLRKVIAKHAGVAVANNVSAVAVDNKNEKVIVLSGNGFTEASQSIEDTQKSSEVRISLLIESLQAEDAQVRAAAALALGKIGDEKAIPFLCDLLAADQNPEVRRNAAEALGMIGSQETEIKG